MKKIITILAFILMISSLNAQIKKVDLAIKILSPVEGQVIVSGKEYTLKYELKNLGPDDMPKMPSYVQTYTKVGNNTPSNLRESIQYGNKLIKGGSIVVTKKFTINVTTPNNNYPFFTRQIGSNTANFYYTDLNKANDKHAITLKVVTKPLKKLDLKIALVAPKMGDKLLEGTEYPIEYKIINNGPTVLPANEMINTYIKIDGEKPFILRKTVKLTKELKVGESYVVKNKFTPKVKTTNPKMPFCAGYDGAFNYKDTVLGNNEGCITINAVSTVGIAQLKAIKGIEIYPNPVNNLLHLDINSQITSEVKIVLYNVLGSKVKTIFDGENNQGNKQISADVSMLPDGIYFYKITLKNESITKRIVISH